MIEFLDNNGEQCSIQNSSSALEDKIWLGISNPIPRILCQDFLGEGVGWMNYPLHEDAFIGGRMHLNKEQATMLIKELQYFVDNGYIREEVE